MPADKAITSSESKPDQVLDSSAIESDKSRTALSLEALPGPPVKKVEATIPADQKHDAPQNFPERSLKDAQAEKAASTEQATVFGARADVDKNASGDIIRVRMPDGVTTERLGDNNWVSTVKGQLVQYPAKGNFVPGSDGSLQFKPSDGSQVLSADKAEAVLANVNKPQVTEGARMGDVSGTVKSTVVGLTATGDIVNKVNEVDLSDGRKLLRQDGVDKFSTVFPTGEKLNFQGNVALKGDAIKVVTPFPKNDVQVAVQVIVDGKELAVNNDYLKQSLDVSAPTVEGHASEALQKAGILNLSPEQAEQRLKLTDSISTGKSVQIQYRIELTPGEAAALEKNMQSNPAYANYKLEDIGTIKQPELDPKTFVPSGGDAKMGAYEYDSTKADVTSTEALIVKTTPENGLAEDMLVVGRRGRAPYKGELAVAGGFFDKGKDGQIENYKMALKREAEEESKGGAIDRGASRLSDVYFVGSDPRSNFTADHFVVTPINEQVAKGLDTGDDMGSIKSGDPIATPINSGDHSFGFIPVREALENNRLLAFDYAKKLQEDPVHGLPADELALMKQVNADPSNKNFEVVGFKNENGEKTPVVSSRLGADGKALLSAEDAAKEFDTFRSTVSGMDKAVFASSPEDSVMRLQPPDLKSSGAAKTESSSPEKAQEPPAQTQDKKGVQDDAKPETPRGTATGRAEETMKVSEIDLLSPSAMNKVLDKFGKGAANAYGADSELMLADLARNPSAQERFLSSFADKFDDDVDHAVARAVVKGVGELNPADRETFFDKIGEMKGVGQLTAALIAASALLATIQSAEAQSKTSKKIPFFSAN